MQLRPFKILFASLVLFTTALFVTAQGEPKTTTLGELKNNPPKAPSAAEVMRERIATAKAYLVVKNYPAAVYELENIRRDTNDPTVNRVLNVLLMHAYLEQGDYKKAQSFLKELHKNPAKALDYFAVAGQVVSGARSQLARYQALGVSVSDSTLPDEAKNDLNSMRKTLELIVTQSKLIGKRRELAGTAVAVLEESSAARGNLASDAYDKKRWTDQVAEAREQIVNPRSKIINAVESPVDVQDQTPDLILVAQRVEEESIPLKAEVLKPEPEPDKKPAESLEAVIDGSTITTRSVIPAPIEEKKIPVDNSEGPLAKPETKGIQPTDRKVRVIRSQEKKPTDNSEPKGEQPNVKSTFQVNRKTPVENNVAADGITTPVSMGSLIGYATRRVNPVYPRQARTMRMQGTVKVKVVVDENGKVSKIENTSGPALLKRAANDAIRKWKFKPFERDGQPVKATGFVSFNFNL